MINLSVALNCIKEMKKNGTYSGEKIGIIRKDIYTFVSAVSGFLDSEKGKVVLYKEHILPDNSQLGMGEYMGMRQKPTGRATVESPLCQKEIEKQRAKGSLIMTCGTIIGVPIGYIEEIRI